MPQHTLLSMKRGTKITLRYNCLWKENQLIPSVYINH